MNQNGGRIWLYNKEEACVGRSRSSARCCSQSGRTVGVEMLCLVPGKKMNNFTIFDDKNDALLLFYNITFPSGNERISVASPPLPGVNSSCVSFRSFNNILYSYPRWSPGTADRQRHNGNDALCLWSSCHNLPNNLQWSLPEISPSKSYWIRSNEYCMCRLAEMAFLFLLVLIIFYYFYVPIQLNIFLIPFFVVLLDFIMRAPVTDVVEYSDDVLIVQTSNENRWTLIGCVERLPLQRCGGSGCIDEQEFLGNYSYGNLHGFIFSYYSHYLIVHRNCWCFSYSHFLLSYPFFFLLM
uniref:DUF295 domain-containing protein n=1 Tax=Heterorhabditis bacteriophora TaxID=37862 RepID=A0A1I7WFQ5_HETBA